MRKQDMILTPGCASQLAMIGCGSMGTLNINLYTNDYQLKVC